VSFAQLSKFSGRIRAEFLDIAQQHDIALWRRGVSRSFAVRPRITGKWGDEAAKKSSQVACL